MTTAIIVQARMGSTRLPGKVLAPVLGRPLLAYLLERLQRAKADVVVLATTTDWTDDQVADLGYSMGAEVFQGPEDDVLARYIGAARSVGADTVIRVTADCPLLDPAFVDGALAAFRDCDLLAPIGLPDGMGCEVVERQTLEGVYSLTTAEEREHVTLYLRRRPAAFRLVMQDTGFGLDRERWTVDTAEDLALIERILGTLYPRNRTFTLRDIRDVLRAHPDWLDLNAAIPMGAIERDLLLARGATAMVR